MNEKGEITNQDLGRDGGKMEQKINMAAVESKQEGKGPWMLIMHCLTLLLLSDEVN